MLKRIQTKTSGEDLRSLIWSDGTTLELLTTTAVMMAAASQKNGCFISYDDLTVTEDDI